MAGAPTEADSANLPQPVVAPTTSPAAETPRPLPTPTRAIATPTPAAPAEPLTAAAAQQCLDEGEVLYGIALQNSNVRQSAESTACRVGRVPKGSLVRIIGFHVSAAQAATATALPRPTPAATQTPPLAEPAIGFVEDIQPIFVRTCNTCHSAIVRNKELQVTSYAGVMKGSTSGVVVVPGDPTGSILWQQLEMGRMPMIGSLSDAEKSRIRDWIAAGAPERRARPPAQNVEPTPAPEEVADALPASGSASGRTWFVVDRGDFNALSDPCAAPVTAPLNVVSSELILPVACESAPSAGALDALRLQLALPIAMRAGESVPPPASAAATQVNPAAAVTAAAPEAIAAENPDSGPSELAASAVVADTRPAFAPASASATGIQVTALGLPAPTDEDGWLAPRGGLCVERKLPNNTRGITALTFAPDGRLFLALDSNLASEVDPLILYDAHHPSRSVAVMDSATMQGLTELLVESPRITGLDWEGGNLFISRASEVGVIPDGGEYDTLASGFAVTSQLFHANNGIVISNGWLYLAAGGVIDGYSDGPIVGMGEAGAQQVASGGNPYAARIVRAPVDRLLSERSIGAFSTAARGARNPYGIAVDPAAQIWFTDNGATNVPEGVSAGDEVNVLNQAAAGASDADAPYYGFPLAITEPKEWYSRPAVVLPNTAAPTGIAWALGTIYFAQYGRDPGLYRIGSDANGNLLAERVLLGWPILSLATAPDGALWMGMGDGGLFRITTGCQG